MVRLLFVNKCNRRMDFSMGIRQPDVCTITLNFVNFSTVQTNETHEWIRRRRRTISRQLSRTTPKAVMKFNHRERDRETSRLLCFREFVPRETTTWKRVEEKGLASFLLAILRLVCIERCRAFDAAKPSRVPLAFLFSSPLPARPFIHLSLDSGIRFWFLPLGLPTCRGIKAFAQTELRIYLSNARGTERIRHDETLILMISLSRQTGSKIIRRSYAF